MLNKLYIIKSKDADTAVVILSDASHPVFRAHFPSHPILPGFIHFEIVGDVFNIEIESIKKAKFLKPALPGQTLIYKRNGSKFKVICEDKEIASFTL